MLYIYIYIYKYMYIYIYIYISISIYIIFLFFSGGETLNFKMAVKKGLPIFKRNFARLMGSYCHIKVCLF